MKKILFILFAGLFISNEVLAEAIPKSTRYDKRVKNVIYNPDNVTRINVAPGITNLIQFSASEYINDDTGGAALGDPTAWRVNIRGNNVWLRPAAPQPDTNLTIVTNKRTYLFNLVSVQDANAASWGVRFTYPDLKKDKNEWSKPCQGDIQNYRYFAKGDKELIPVEVWDNGTFTCISIKAGVDLPVVFKKFPDKSEGLVNSHIENGFIVIHEVNPEYRLRLGELVVGIKTDKLKSIGTNNTGTTNGKIRGIAND
ncbi:TrbG/VirB9 family P-type conjugative transfer protein [Gilliamella sp. W8126]|uniref:TrbG/VirB9 family P-type conjugative transfer protein n=1 Tax=Gilliamella sp. W8126 TaxID=2750946 RepID=UPI0018DB83CE|nr:TrbG/VirB9 family P-type conjugative transfer protein [Gilliamella sp. W8126]MBI0006990.1 TrbG/VirB9 family P-type conjugative transfer protein [Gilliamella sp. W8126]